MAAFGVTDDGRGIPVDIVSKPASPDLKQF